LLLRQELRLLQPEFPRRPQAAVTPYKNDVSLEERVVAFPSQLAAEIERNEVLLVHEGDYLGE
jgi:hypothetical protein